MDNADCQGIGKASLESWLLLVRAYNTATEYSVLCPGSALLLQKTGSSDSEVQQSENGFFRPRNQAAAFGVKPSSQIFRKQQQLPRLDQTNPEKAADAQRSGASAAAQRKQFFQLLHGTTNAQSKIGGSGLLTKCWFIRVADLPPATSTGKGLDGGWRPKDRDPFRVGSAGG